MTYDVFNIANHLDHGEWSTTSALLHAQMYCFTTPSSLLLSWTTWVREGGTQLLVGSPSLLLLRTAPP